ncbi:titin isoform X7 [Brachionus plicatilis]|uniref:Titin isoform X7 n=1 Tax=Brachionus plicatilis TaxID=10195 RepID=A0A3M7REK7_BRAPC|nr:titin isoform X7 [Brachionus plicatilis]
MDANRPNLSVRSLASLGDSFDQSIIQASQPAELIHVENSEENSTEHGLDTKTTRTVRQLVGQCARIGAREAVGRQVRETKETLGDGLKAFSDYKTESIVGEDGTRLTRTCQTSNVRYSRGRSHDPYFSSDKNHTLSTLTSYSPYSLPPSRSFHSYSDSHNQLVSLDTRRSSSHRYSDQGMFMNRQTPTIKEIVPPTFSYEIEDFKLKEGQTAYFKGTVNGSYPFETIWYLEKERIKPNSRIQITMKQDCSETFLTGLIDYIISLKILNCTPDDLGKYTCYVKNEAGDASCSAYLILEENFEINDSRSSESFESYATVPRCTQTFSINTESVESNQSAKSETQHLSSLISSNEIDHDLRPRFTSRLSNQSVHLDERVVFSCQFYSQTQILRINWYHNGSQVDSQSKYTIKNEENKTSLFIFRAGYEDNGHYELRVENRYGYSITSAKLLVEKKMEKNEKRASVTKIIQVQDRRNSEKRGYEKEIKEARYSVTKILPVKRKMSVDSGLFQKERDINNFKRSTSVEMKHENKMVKGSTRRCSVTKIFQINQNQKEKRTEKANINFEIENAKKEILKRKMSIDIISPKLQKIDILRQRSSTEGKKNDKTKNFKEDERKTNFDVRLETRNNRNLDFTIQQNASQKTLETRDIETKKIDYVTNDEIERVLDTKNNSYITFEDESREYDCNRNLDFSIQQNASQKTLEYRDIETKKIDYVTNDEIERVLDTKNNSYITFEDESREYDCNRNLDFSIQQNASQKTLETRNIETKKIDYVTNDEKEGKKTTKNDSYITFEDESRENDRNKNLNFFDLQIISNTTIDKEKQKKHVHFDNYIEIQSPHDIKKGSGQGIQDDKIY